MAAFLRSLRFFFVAILLLLSIEPTTPVPSRVASQWRERPSSYNGDHNSSEMAGGPPVGHRARTTRATPSKYVRTTLLFGVHPSSRILVPPIGRRARTTRTTPSNYVRTTLRFGAHSSSRLLVLSVGRRARTTRTTSSEYVRTTLLFGAHSSSRRLVASVPRQLYRIDHSAAELPKPHQTDLFVPRSASILHCTSPRVAGTSPEIGRRPVLFCASGLRHMHDAPRTSILESTLRMTIDGNFAC